MSCGADILEGMCEYKCHEKIAYVRKRLGIRQRELAKRLGLTQPDVSKLERWGQEKQSGEGKAESRRLKAEMAPAMARALGVTLRYLLDPDAAVADVEYEGPHEVVSEPWLEVWRMVRQLKDPEEAKARIMLLPPYHLRGSDPSAAAETANRQGRVAHKQGTELAPQDGPGHRRKK
jgi:transcriptional regulator with XRE-family HTH domain